MGSTYKHPHLTAKLNILYIVFLVFLSYYKCVNDEVSDQSTTRPDEHTSYKRWSFDHWSDARIIFLKKRRPFEAPMLVWCFYNIWAADFLAMRERFRLQYLDYCQEGYEEGPKIRPQKLLNIAKTRPKIGPFPLYSHDLFFFLGSQGIDQSYRAIGHILYHLKAALFFILGNIAGLGGSLDELIGISP